MVEEEAKALVRNFWPHSQGLEWLSKEPCNAPFQMKKPCSPLPLPNTDRHGWPSQTVCGGQGSKNARSPLLGRHSDQRGDRRQRERRLTGFTEESKAQAGNRVAGRRGTYLY